MLSSSRIIKLYAGCLVAGLVMLLAASATFAQQEWPNRPVQIMVPFAAGGSGDVLARVVAQHLTKSLKQQFVVENRPGGGGIIGTRQFLAQAADGYTIGMSSLSTLSLVPVINSNAGYDPDHDFVHIAYIGGSPVVLAAGPQTRVQTLADFIVYASTPGNSFTFASSGVGSDGQLWGELIAASTGVKAEHVPYKATAQALSDLVAGHVPFSTFTLSSTSPFLHAKSLRGLAVTAAERMPEFPEVPTFKELGYDGLVGTTWFALSGPLRIPEDIVDKINEAVVAAVATPEIVARFRRDGFMAQPMNAAEFAQFVAAENIKWKSLIERVGLMGAEH
jgi:tripartite-type tricarboxylate transporter receptor subunit TctC